MLPWLERASIDWAREMRGIASMAIAVTPAEARGRTPSELVSGSRKPMRVAPWPSLATSSGVGGATLTTMSALQGSPIVAPASVYCSSGSRAPSAAPDSTITSCPLPVSLRATSGTMATRRSPAWVSFGIPILIRAAGTLASGHGTRASPAHGRREAVVQRPRGERAGRRERPRVVHAGDGPGRLLVAQARGGDQPVAGAERARRRAAGGQERDAVGVQRRAGVDAAGARAALDLLERRVLAQHAPRPTSTRRTSLPAVPPTAATPASGTLARRRSRASVHAGPPTCAHSSRTGK